MSKTHRSKTRIFYHGRVGFPIIHTSVTGRSYFMARKLGGGTKRVYLDTYIRKLGVDIMLKKRRSAKAKWGKIGAPHSARRKAWLKKLRNRRKK